VFEHVADPGALVEAPQETAAFVVVATMFDQRRQPGLEAVHKTGQLVGRIVLEFANVDPGFEGRGVGPDARTAQGNDVPDDDVFFLHDSFARLRFTVKIVIGADGDY